jgi:predicted nucleic acid-binding protein
MTKFIDTNILIYAFDTESAAKSEKAKKIIEDLSLGKHIVSAQVAGEFARVLTEKYKITPEKVELFLADLPIHVHYSKNTLLNAIKFMQHHLHFWDAVIAATMLENNIHEIYTEEESFNHVPGITAVNPFKE